jgi:hypothetical protein
VDGVEVEPVAEPPARLAVLPPQRLHVVVLDLGRVGVDVPVGRVYVAPLGGDDRAGGLPRPQPVAEELLRAAVGARGVEVADAALPRRVEHLVGARAQGGHRAILAEVLGVAEVQITGAAERREAESERRHAARLTIAGMCG